MKKIAMYGKGGIGKSTIAVNLALTFAKMNYKIGLIGCDPKGDTCRLLSPKKLPTILDNYREIKKDINKIKDLTYNYKNQIECIEVGGPKPGVGCAGKGIILGLDLLKKYNFYNDKDIIIYDVLGDVVCGGFASPVSKGYAEEVYIVSSGEQSSLFAANNIIKGITQIGGNIQGLIYNSKNIEKEYEIVGEFSKRSNIPIVGKISYSKRIPLLELRKKAVVTEYPEGKEAKQFIKISNNILNKIFDIKADTIDDEDVHEIIKEIKGDSYVY
ncbi:MAG: P-loop NTPase [Bacillota bacterium]